uniref:Uncharacterized protein n=1 Tax=Opuntia streptacantha TaxID=393608 RepID=A0A7C9E109_OPUST
MQYAHSFGVTENLDVQLIVNRRFFHNKLELLIPSWIPILLNFLGFFLIASKSYFHRWVCMVLPFQIVSFMHNHNKYTSTSRRSLRGVEHCLILLKVSSKFCLRKRFVCQSDHNLST